MAVDRHLPARETSSSVSPFNKREVTTGEEEGRGGEGRGGEGRGGEGRGGEGRGGEGRGGEEEGRGEDIHCNGFNFSSTVYQACRNKSFEHEETQMTTS